MRARGWNRVVLAYCGTIDPMIYGVRFTDWNTQAPAELTKCSAVAISVNYLCGIDYGRDMFADFRELTPDVRAGDSIWLYDLARPKVTAALSSARDKFGLRTSY
jgi:hypothetical protein